MLLYEGKACANFASTKANNIRHGLKMCIPVRSLNIIGKFHGSEKFRFTVTK